MGGGDCRVGFTVYGLRCFEDSVWISRALVCLWRSVYSLSSSNLLMRKGGGRLQGLGFARGGYGYGLGA